MKYFLIAIFTLIISTCLQAQLWTGGYGDPVMNIDFGYGNNPGRALSSGITSYTNTGSTCPREGEYSLINLTFSCFENSWHTLSGDHTPDDGGGYYMMINSASTKGTFFNYTVKGLCPNTTYEFAAWIKNALRPTACNREGVSPNLTFTIETTSGTLLKTYNSGNITSSEDPQWQQYGTTFTTSGSATEVVLRIINSAISGCGNVLALDDITLRACGPRVDASIQPSGKIYAEVCAGSTPSFPLSADYQAGYSNPVLQWQKLNQGVGWENIDGASSKVFTIRPAATGTYVYRLIVGEAQTFASGQCQVASNEIHIEILHPPFVQATNYVYGCLGGDITLFASGANSYSWTGPNGFKSDSASFLLPAVQYTDAGLYKVTGTTYLGCKNADSTLLRVVPNATAESSAGTYICEGTATRLNAKGGVRYRWQPPTGLSSDTVASPLASPTESTRYKVKVSNEYGCFDTASVSVNVWKKPVANAGADIKTRVGFPVTLHGAATGTDVSWYWSPSSGLPGSQQLDPTTNPAQSGSFRFNVVSSHGCGTATDDVFVRVYDKILIPNAFSPNGDGINDTWNIDPLFFFKDAVTEVYNRYGQIVYRTTGYDTQWNGTSNGKPLPIGTYFYIIDLRNTREPKLTGSVTILR